MPAHEEHERAVAHDHEGREAEERTRPARPRRVLVWRGLDAFRAEIAHVELDGEPLAASGTQIGVDYELRYWLDDAWLRVEIVGSHERELELDATDFFDLGFSPLFNTLPILRDELHRGGEPRDYVMSLVDVPSLEVSRSEQRYEPFAPGLVRFRAGEFTALLELDDDGFVVRYPGLAERVG
jgi:hypothetical protein